MRNALIPVLVVLALLEVALLPQPVAAQRRVTRTIDVSVDHGTGEKTRGPATITLTNINVLRYDVAIGRDVHFVAGPDLAGLPFIPTVPAAGEAGEGVSNVPPAGSPLAPLRARLAGIETTYGSLRNRVITATRLVADAASRLDALLRTSDAVLQIEGAQAVRQRATELRLQDALDTPWPVGPELEVTLVALSAIESELSTIAMPSDPPDNQVYAYIKARIPQLRTALEALRDTGDLAAAFKRAQDDLRRWHVIVSTIANADGDPFARVISADCGFQFESTKETKFDLVIRDRLTANAPEVRRELITVVCSSPLTISGGFGFSFVDEQTFALVSSKPPEGESAAVSKFGSSARSTYRPLPVLLLNTRVWEFDDTWSLHGSAGAVVDISTGEAGTDVEFVLGPTVAMSRTFFLTAGWHWGRVSRLVGGFVEGDPVPEGVTEPPLEKSWSRTFALLATWKLR